LFITLSTEGFDKEETNLIKQENEILKPNRPIESEDNFGLSERPTAEEALQPEEKPLRPAKIKKVIKLIKKKKADMKQDQGDMDSLDEEIGGDFKMMESGEVQGPIL
jgi:hypothetical protein